MSAGARGRQATGAAVAPTVPAPSGGPQADGPGAPGGVLRRAHDAMRAHVASGRVPERCGPLEVFREPRGGALAAFAMPRPGAVPSAADLDALHERFAATGLRARLEYLPQLAPEVEARARAHDFAVELRSPLMVSSAPASLVAPVPGLTLELVTPDSPDASIRGLVDAQREAFAAPPGEVDCDGWRARHVGIWLLGRVDGEPAAGGCLTLAHRGAAEAAGIGVRQGFRRQGIAAALTAELVRRGHAAGLDLVFLTPGGQEAQRVYARAGFTPAGETLHLRA